MIDQFVNAFNNSTLLNAFIPMPEALQPTEDGRVSPPDTQIALQLYGYKDWYDFSVSEWGVKWDVGALDCGGGTGGDIERMDDNTVVGGLQSAYSPPREAFKKMGQLGFLYELNFDEAFAYIGLATNEGECLYTLDFEQYKNNCADWRNLIPTKLHAKMEHFYGEWLEIQAEARIDKDATFNNPDATVAVGT